MRERGATIHRVELDEHDPLPDWRGFEAIIAMGGPMSVNDEERLPWLRDEKALINDAVRAGVPFFGACLGAQLLSASLGGIVFQGPEAGGRPASGFSHAGGGKRSGVRRHPARNVDFPVARRHVLVADRGRFCWRVRQLSPTRRFAGARRAYGVQFHLEVSLDMAREWLQVPEYARSLNDSLGPGSAATLIDEFGEHEGRLRAHGRRLFERWLDLC